MYHKHTGTGEKAKEASEQTFDAEWDYPEFAPNDNKAEKADEGKKAKKSDIERD